MLSRLISLVALLLLASVATAQSTDAYCPPRAATAAEQEKIWEEFYDLLWVKRDVKTAFGRHVHEDYIQHNPYAVNGRQAAVDYLVVYWATVQHTLYNKVFKDGFGWTQHRKDIPGKPFDAVIDILRFNGTCIVEHWDVMQTKPDNATNPHPLF
jgi:predicted SnoaL-like aldol condensation-catalyzing enzyme